MNIKNLKRGQVAVAASGSNIGHLLLGLREGKVVCLTCHSLVEKDHSPNPITEVTELVEGPVTFLSKITAL